MKKHKRYKSNAKKMGFANKKEVLVWLEEKEREDRDMHALYGSCQYDMCSGIHNTYQSLYDLT